METLFHHRSTKTLELIAKVKRRPRFLYKYCTFADYRSAAIVENRIWVSLPSKLNDPFDVQPEIRPLKRREIDTKILHAIAEMDASQFVQTADGYDFVDGKVKDFPKEILLQILNNSSFIRDAFYMMGVHSFSSVGNSNLLWSYYAGGHSGLLIGYAVPPGGRVHQ
ncbi:hypothetical protein EPK99_04275 [Neorhizobium lilium]|uniref:DUF2971 domain-containing protein n=1 Tax=Neorhizobium lilium TaxID=2503024 RepID=A0A3S3SIT0_9HYPH|nr:hypothetical protein [Neorhizobium lilium]RWX81511.1 hypothetical protein EPK99_04275 [Neorhizobium lilium]